MMPKSTFISNNELKLSDIPLDTDDWRVISRFAYTIDGYKELGGSKEEIQLKLKDIHSNNKIASLAEARIRLFMLARGESYWSFDHPTPEIMRSVKKTLEYIRENVGRNK